MAEMDKILPDMRVLGKALGFLYPSKPPNEKVLGPRLQPNHLSYTCRPTFPLPLLLDVTEGCKNLTTEDYEIIANNVQINSQVLEKYRTDLVGKVGDLYDRAASGFNYIDSSITFYLELYAHCDGSMRDLVRSKLATLFHQRLRDAVQGHDLSRLVL